jgi:hypothetical protein
MFNPFVQGWTVGPTSKPLLVSPSLFKSTRFIKNDLPVLYLPTTETIPNYVSSGILVNKSRASFEIQYPFSSYPIRRILRGSCGFDWLLFIFIDSSSGS